jgi:beta-glucanase (GH16 family)
MPPTMQTTHNAATKVLGRHRRVFRRVPLALLASFGLVIGLASSTAGSSTSSTDGALQPATSNTPAGDCGGVGPVGMSGSWTCTFDDEFNETSLNTSMWVPQVTATSGYTSGDTACFVNNPANISVSGGYLHLTALQTPAPFTCDDPFGNFTTQETSGMVSTYGLFSQTYGAFEVNAELPSSVIEGLQETFWLYPQSLTGYGPWPDSGEVDFAEFYSEYPVLDVPYIHYREKAPDPNVTAYDCVITPDAFNTYGVDWSPGVISVYDNGNLCLTDTYDPASPLTSPEPFNQPFFISLTQALGLGTNNYTPGVTQLPATTLIKYVRAWEPAS